MTLRDKILNVLSAGALGDAFGYVVEFDDWDAIQIIHGPLGLQVLKDNPNIPLATDDTQMTLFACEGIIQGLWSKRAGPVEMVEYARASFQRWLETQSYKDDVGGLLGGYTALYARRAPGMTCLGSLSDPEQAFASSSNPGNQSKGCGAVMRTAPYAFLINKFTDDEIWNIAADSGAITHGHVDGWGSAAALSYAMALMLRGLPFDLAFTQAAKRAVCAGAVGTCDLIVAALGTNGRMHPEAMCDYLGEGWTGDEALAIAIYAAKHATSVMDAIILGANHRGDSDSTASIAGQIAALRFGMTYVEQQEFSRVDLAPVVSHIADLMAGALEQK